jgi:hypothetical protein
MPTLELDDGTTPGEPVAPIALETTAPPEPAELVEQIAAEPAVTPEPVSASVPLSPSEPQAREVVAAPAGGKRTSGRRRSSGAPPGPSQVSRVARVLDRLFAKDAKLTAELMQELRNCTSSDFVVLFRPPPGSEPPPAKARSDNPNVDAPAVGTPPAEPRWENPGVDAEPAVEPGLIWTKRGAEAEIPGHLQGLQQEHPPKPMWDETGRRISGKLPSAFEWTKGSERPVSRRTHWSA